MEHGDGMQRENPLEAVEIGLCESFSKTIGESDVYLFAGITGDLHPLHVDEQFAASTRFGARIVHGALLVGFVSTVMSRINGHLPPPGGVSTHYDVHFLAPVFLGDTITTALTVHEKSPERGEIVLVARSENQRGEAVLEGRAFLRIARPRVVSSPPLASEDRP